MELFIYADETGQENEFYGTGAFISTKPIEQSFIDNIVKELQPFDLQNKDLKSLNSGVFHATDNTDIVREIFINHINNLSGKFVFTLYKTKGSIGKSQKEAAYRNTLGLSSMTQYDTPVNKVTLIVEERSSFSQDAANNWKREWFHEMDIQSNHGVIFKTFYPEVQIILGKKSIPGLQVADYLTWISRRTYLSPSGEWHKNKWFGLIKSPFKYVGNGERLFTFDLKLNPKRLKDPQFRLYSFQERIQLPQQTYRLLKLLEIHQEVKSLLLKELPKNCTHLLNDLPLLKRGLPKGKHFNTKALVEICEFYIRVFDNLPVYRGIANNNIDEWRKILTNKMVAAWLLSKASSEFKDGVAQFISSEK